MSDGSPSSLSACRHELSRRYEYIRTRLSAVPHGNFVSSLLEGGPRPLELVFTEKETIHSIRLSLLQQFPKYRSPLFIRGIEFADVNTNNELELIPAQGCIELSSFYEEFGGFPHFAVNQIQEPYAFHTKIEHSPWAVITLDQPVFAQAIRLHTRLRPHETVSMQTLQIAIRSSEDDEWKNVFDYQQLLKEFVDEGTRAFPPLPESGFSHEDAAAVDSLLLEALLGNYDHYRLYYRFMQMSPAVCTEDVIALLDENIARPRGLAATSYGINCPFSLWSEEEKQTALNAALELIEKLKTLSPNVCFAFGTALGFVREQGFIPHDRDIDIYLGLDEYSFPLSKENLDEIARKMTELGLWVVWVNEHASLKNIFVASGVPKLPILDVYLCVTSKNDDQYHNPNSLHDKYIPRDEIFPPSYVQIYKKDCPVPRDTERYLYRAYGENWKQPIDVNSNHNKEQERYRKL